MKFIALFLLLSGFSIYSQAQAYSFGWEQEAIGKPAKPFSFTTADGKKITSASLAGKVIVLDFWATWCSPCRTLTKELDSALQEYYDKDFQMIGVNYKEKIKKGDPVAYWKEHAYKFPMVVDGDAYGDAVKAGNPVVIVIDQQGIVRGKWQAWTNNRAAEVATLVWQLIEKPEVTSQAVIDANRNKEYNQALYCYDSLIKREPAEEAELAQEKFRALLHVSEWQAVDFAKEQRAKYHDSIETLSYVGDLISQTNGLAPKIYQYGAETFEMLLTKDTTLINSSLIVYDLMGRCYFKSNNLEKALINGEISLEIAKSTNAHEITLKYLEDVLKKYKAAGNNKPTDTKAL